MHKYVFLYLLNTIHYVLSSNGFSKYCTKTVFLIKYEMNKIKVVTKSVIVNIYGFIYIKPLCCEPFCFIMNVLYSLFNEYVFFYELNRNSFHSNKFFHYVQRELKYLARAPSDWQNTTQHGVTVGRNALRQRPLRTRQTR